MADKSVMPSGATSAEVRAREFTKVRRGYDPDEVRAYLTTLAAELGRLQDEANRASSAVTVTEPAPHTLDRKELTAHLGEAAARILDAAQEAADDTKSKAEANVARLLREARDEASAIRATAAEERTALAEEAERQASAARAEAVAERERAHEAVESELARAKEQGRAMIAEARAIRERLLAEMNDRRRESRLQVEQLRAAGDHLRQLYMGLRDQVDQQLRQLELAPGGAQAAADRVAATTVPEPWPERDVLAAETGHDHTAAGDPEPVAESMAEPAADVVATDVADPDAEPDAVPDAVPDAETDALPDAVPEAEPDAVPDAEPASGDRRTTSGDDPATGQRLADDPGAGPGATVADVVRLDAARPASGASEPVSPPSAAVPPVDEVRRRRQERSRTIQPRRPRPSPVRPPSSVPSPVAAPGADDAVDRLFARLRAQRDEPEAGEAADAATTTRSQSDPAASGAPTDEPAARKRTSGVRTRVTASQAVSADELGAELLNRRAQATERVAPDTARALKRAVNDWQNELLARLRSARGATTVDEVVGEGPASRLAAVLQPSLGPALEAGYAGAERPTGADRLLGDAVGRVAADLAGSLRTKITAEPVDLESLGERSRAVVREWRQTKAAPAAVDAVRLAFGYGVLAAQPDANLVRWLCPPEGCRSADCQDNSLADPVPAGEPFPTGDVVAPACPGCSCLVVPVAS